METELWGNLDGWIIRNHILFNMMLVAESFLLLLMWLKMYFIHDGALRIHFLWLFGVWGTTTVAAVLLYHPFYNVWFMPLRELTHAFALLHFTIYIIQDFGIGGEH